jgi:cell division protein FtsQ
VLAFAAKRQLGFDSGLTLKIYDRTPTNMPRAAATPTNATASATRRLLRSAAVPAPADVRLMNQVSSMLFVVLGAVVLIAALWWLVRSPVFAIRDIQLEGEMVHNSAPSIRAGVQGVGAQSAASSSRATAGTPQLTGNFFSVDLERGRAAFEAVPWVRKAVVRRVWPDHLAVRLEEHVAAAFWEGADSHNVNQDSDKLVNSFGEVFQADVGDVDDGLPVLTGPEGAAAQMLRLLQRLQPVLARLEVSIDKLALSGRGSWRAELDSGAVVEMGRGSEDELVARLDRFVRTLKDATAAYVQQPLEYADLRHADGYALRLRGVSTSSGVNGVATNATSQDKPRRTQTASTVAPVPRTAAASVKKPLVN